MSRSRSFQVEILEEKVLLSGAHVGHPLQGASSTTTPLVVDGTLNVSYKSTTSTMNIDGTSTITAPVSGKLGSLGLVRGIWNESKDNYGNLVGLDTLRLTGSKGTFALAFNNNNPGPGHATGHGGVYYVHAQHFVLGTKAYAHASESGSIVLTTNAKKSEVVSLTLQTATT